MGNFFAMLSRMKYINRWGLKRNTLSENIAEHSLEVAYIAHALALIRERRLGIPCDAERAAVASAGRARYHELFNGARVLKFMVETMLGESYSEQYEWAEEVYR